MFNLHLIETICAVFKIGHIQEFSHFFMLYQIAVVRTRNKYFCFFVIGRMWQFKWSHNKRTNSKRVSFWNAFHQFACSDVHVLNRLIIGVNLNACVQYFFVRLLMIALINHVHDLLSTPKHPISYKKFLSEFPSIYIRNPEVGFHQIQI